MSILLLQVPLIKNIKGVKIGFLGYCNVAHDPGFSDDLSVRRQFKIGMALYDEELVKRDVDKLKVLNTKFISPTGYRIEIYTIPVTRTVHIHRRGRGRGGTGLQVPPSTNLSPRVGAKSTIRREFSLMITHLYIVQTLSTYY